MGEVWRLNHTHVLAKEKVASCLERFATLNAGLNSLNDHLTVPLLPLLPLFEPGIVKFKVPNLSQSRHRAHPADQNSGSGQEIYYR